ncbi:hypothetical protein BO70DRAFT_404778, partial [Aspergillus heteromorphus CBS 117.55]
SIPEREPEKRLPHPRKAAGAQITQSRHGEYNLNPLTRNNWRQVVPAAAVIPAPIAYIKVVAVKKLVVEPWSGWPVRLTASTGPAGPFLLGIPWPSLAVGEPGLLL